MVERRYESLAGEVAGSYEHGPSARHSGADPVDHDSSTTGYDDPRKSFRQSSTRGSQMGMVSIESKSKKYEVKVYIPWQEPLCALAQQKK